MQLLQIHLTTTQYLMHTCPIFFMYGSVVQLAIDSLMLLPNLSHLNRRNLSNIQDVLMVTKKRQKHFTKMEWLRVFRRRTNRYQGTV